MKDERIVAFGGAIKALGDGRVGGYLVRFTDEHAPDLEGDYFTKATDYDVTDGDPVTVYYNHGLDATIKRRKLGRGTVAVHDVGVWVEAQLELRDEYERAIYDMVQAGKVGWSSGTLPNLVEREPAKSGAMWIKSWPIGKDASITPTPAAGPLLTTVQPLKTWADATQYLEALLPEAGPDHPAAGATERGADAKAILGDEEGHIMSEGKAPEVIQRADRDQAVADQIKSMLTEWKATAVDPVNQRLDSLSTTVDKLLKHMEDEPAIRRAGYYTVDGGSADKGIKSFGDWLLSIKRGDHTRLATVYKSAADYDDNASKALGVDSGGGGGYLVPEEYEQRLLQMTAMQNGIVSRVTTIPVTRTSGEWPALDQYVAPTAGAGNTAFAGGVTAAITAEAGTLTETDAAFEMLDWRLHKIGGYTKVSNELIADSAQSIEALLSSLFGIAIAGKTEYFLLRGTGVGQPLGILNSSAAIAITPDSDNTFGWGDVAEMYSRFKSAGGSPVWIIHPSIWPDIMQMEVGSAGANAWTANMTAGPAQTLNGYPIIVSEHLPQANSSGAVILADLTAYIRWVKSGLAIGFSEHVGFLADQGTWRFTLRQDGKPWMKNTITLADPGGSYTVSPFVYHND